MRPFVENLRAEVGRLGAGRLMLGLVLFLAPWHYKIISSLPRVLDVTRWWAPSLFPETLVTVAAAIVSLVVLRRSPVGRIPGARLLIAGFVLCVAALAVSSVTNERHTVYLVRVVVLQYAVAAVVFWLVWRHTETPTHLATLTGALVAGGGLLYLVATPVYFISLSHFPPPWPIPWPPSRLLYNRGILGQFHNDPKMLYDNVTFGNVLNVSQVLVVLLPLALGLAFVARSIRRRVTAIGAATLFALHLDFCYSRGPLLVTVATLAIVGWLVHREYPKARVVTAVALTGWVVLTFGAPDVLRYWYRQFAFQEASTSRERLHFVLQPLGFRDTGPTAAVAPGTRYQVVTVPRSSYVRMAVAGLGYGNYGVLIGRIPGSGTHNVFLNVLVSTGVMGLLGLIGLTVWAVRNFGRYLNRTARAGRSKVLGLFLAVAFGNVLAVGVLSLYELEYLGTGTGATLFAFLLGASARLVTFAEGQSFDGVGHAR
jgi:hypothetical protein